MPRILLIFGAAVIISFLSVALYFSEQRFESKGHETQISDERDYKVRIEKEKPFAAALDSDPVAYFTKWLFISTTALTVFTAGLAVVTVMIWLDGKETSERQHIASRRAIIHAAKSARAAENAVISAKRSSEMQLRAYLAIVKCELATNKSALLVYVKNCGQTPALSVSCRNNFQWHPPGGNLPENFDWSDYHGNYNPTISGYWGPAQEIPITFEINTELLENVKAGRLIVYVYGHIDYVDWFKNTRSIEFCFKGLRVEDRFAIRMHGEHNTGS